MVEPGWTCGMWWRLSLYGELPLDANVQFITVMATQMPFIGAGKTKALR